MSKISADAATALHVAADCLACGAWVPSEAEEGREIADAVLAELPPEQAARLRAALAASADHRAIARLLDELATELEPPARPPKPHRPRKATLARALKQAAKAGVKVARVDVSPDGTVSLVVGEGQNEEPSSDLDQWIAKHAHQIKRA